MKGVKTTYFLHAPSWKSFLVRLRDLPELELFEEIPSIFFFKSLDTTKTLHCIHVKRNEQLGERGPASLLPIVQFVSYRELKPRDIERPISGCSM